MRRLSEKQALRRLQKIKTDFRAFVRENYEHKAKDCLTCETRGACCLDAHFVNVHISRLEAVAIRREIETFTVKKQREIYSRIGETIEKYDLDDTQNSSAKTFACPLFEKQTGCLVHAIKPVPCIQHACYERREDLPPDEIQFAAEEKIARLEARTYAPTSEYLPLPIWLAKLKKLE